MVCFGLYFLVCFKSLTEETRFARFCLIVLSSFCNILHYSVLRDYLQTRVVLINWKNSVLNFSDYCSFNSSCTHPYSLSLIPPQSTINSYRYSFFVNVIFLWNTVPAAVLTINLPLKFCHALYPLLFYFMVLIRRLGHHCMRNY